MPTKAELKQKAKPAKLKLRRGDRVMIISGKDKGEIGEILSVSPKDQKAFVARRSEENADELIPLNAAIKHRKAAVQGEKSARVKIPVPLHTSKLMLIDPTTNQPTRVGRRKEDGKVVRYAKKSGKTLADAPPADKKD